MNRRSTLKAAIGACAALLFPWGKSRANSTQGNAIQDMIQKRAETLRLRAAEPFNIILSLGRQQLWHVKQSGQKAVAMRLGKRERRIIVEGSDANNRLLGIRRNDPATHFAGVPIQWDDPATHFSGVPIQWTDNECEMTIVLKETTP